jgi:tetratricopeptide (TPR) repeat protein
MKYLPQAIKFFGAIIIIAFFFALELFAQEVVVSDSALKKLSVEELVKLRKILANQRDNLYKRQEKSRQRGVEISTEFLDKTFEENANQDKILIRIAEYYIDEEDIDFEKRFTEYDRAFDEYDRQLKLYEEGTLKVAPIEPEQPKYGYDDAIYIYDLIISNFPESNLIDEAYYNKAFLLQKMGDDSVAQKIFQKVIDQYPESQYAPEAYMQLAEGFFYPKPNDTREKTILNLKKANQLYQNILSYKGSPRYDEALYKLGWSYYRLAGEDPEYYTDAIVYFTGVVQDIERTKKLDPTGKIVLRDVEPEAIEYIAASFTDTAYSKSGVVNCSSFIEKLGKPDFGKRIMEAMGDRYAKITLWENSRRAFRELLSMYPDYAYGPRIQKKIADSYVAESEMDRAFEERRKLFETYNPKSEWYAQLEQRDIHDRISALNEAYTMSEEALRTNVLYLYNMAKSKEEEGGDSLEYYTQFSEISRIYLNNYPTDENAYDINWSLALILDTKLHRFKDAFEEYIRVSNDYLEDENRYNAAINAIAVADTLAQIDTALVDTTVVEGIEIQKLPPKELTEEQEMLAEAYDNFIKLFPASAETPTILSSAGALYYNHRQFALAKKYYKTMVTKFPEAQQKNIGLISLMNSYFFLGQYRDAEIVAKKVLEVPDIPPDQIEIAKKKLGQSIYKNAEKLEQEEKYVEAANEYVRVYKEASDYVTFADLALFKGAYNFEQAGEWQKAINTYEVLIQNLPESKEILPALGNIAEDYKELEDYANVGRTYERIFNKFPGTEDAEKALYNASLFFARAEEWQEAIRANNIYIAKYPENPESKDLLFENAKYYLKLDNLSSANRIYQDFALKYPNDPRTVEAYYNRGNYYFEHNKFDSARVEFNLAISKSDEFARTGQDPNLYYAAEANYKLGEILYEEYKAIKLGYPPSRLRAQLQQKSKSLEEVRAAFSKVIELGSLRGFEAMYKIAEAYEELANSIANQELSPNLTRDQRLVESNRVFQASVAAYDQAVEEYKNAIINIPKLAEKLDVSMEEDSTESEPQLAMETDTTGIIKKEIKEDSSAAVARKWYELAKVKVSSIEYQVAEKSADFITAYLRTPNPEKGVKAIAYDGLLLQNVVEPLVQSTIQAHLKNLQVSSELSLENKFVIESKRKILLTSNITADEYANAFNKAADLYESSIPVLEDLINRGASATTPEGLDYYDFQDSHIMQLIFYMNKYSKAALNHYIRTLQFSKENNIQNDAKVTTEEKIFNFAYESGNKMSTLADSAKKKIDFYLDQFDETSNQNFQLGSSFFDDQSIELTNYSKEVFETAYNLSKEYNIENIWTQLILAKLAELDPAKYLADLPRENQVFASDSTWLATTYYEPGWNYEDYDDSNWQPSKVVNLPPNLQFALFDSLGINPDAIWAEKTILSPKKTITPALEIQDANFEKDTLSRGTQPLDTVPAGEEAVVEPDTLTANFRKEFNLKSLPVDGKLAITGDKTYRCYLNDVYIIGVDDGDFENARLVPFEAFGNELRVGKNTVACSVTDYDGPPRYGLRFHMQLEFLPIELSEAVAKISEGNNENIDLDKLRQIVILNKNRIVK